MTQYNTDTDIKNVLITISSDLSNKIKNSHMKIADHLEHIKTVLMLYNLIIFAVMTIVVLIVIYIK